MCTCLSICCFCSDVIFVVYIVSLLITFQKLEEEEAEREKEEKLKNEKEAKV